MFARHLLLLSLSSWLVFSATSCHSNSVGPTEPSLGVAGNIYDSQGDPIEGVSVYCLYYLSNVPPKYPVSSLQGMTFSADSFGFFLYQGFPNPNSGNLFIRFSIPQACNAEMSLVNKITGDVILRQSLNLAYGLYQFSFTLLDSNAAFSNGLYSFRLKAMPEVGELYQAENTILCISDKGRPNAVSDSRGYYFFDIRHAAIGDSIAVTADGDVITSQRLYSNVNLLIKKAGYEPVVINTDLLTNRILVRDIVLKKLQ